MKILLLQAREDGDAMLEHELSCFTSRTGLNREHFRSLNMSVEKISQDCLTGIDAVMVGGSGDFSVARADFPWHGPMLELLREIVRREVPTFASCFGHQALAQSLGGEVLQLPENKEVGTFEVSINEAGRQDRLMGLMPPRFMAQLGHQDHVVRLPKEMINLASSHLCEVQATRIKGTSIVTTQFHPELTGEDQLARWMRYINHYTRPDETIEEARERARSMVSPSPEACSLLNFFMEVELSGLSA